MQAVSFEETIEVILKKDPRYHRDAYVFLREALDHTQKVMGRAGTKEQVHHHITGQELLAGIKTYALQQFGPMVLTLFHEWGVNACEDFGEIVFNMVEHNLLAKTDNDSRDDFKAGYDFEEAFRQPFLPSKAISPLEPETKSTEV